MTFGAPSLLFGCLLAVVLGTGLAAFVLWRAGGIDGLTRRSIHAPVTQPR